MVSEPRKNVNASRCPQGMAGLFKDSNAAWLFWDAPPSWRGKKRPSALLYSLGLDSANPAAARLAASHHAEPVNITLK